MESNESLAGILSSYEESSSAANTYTAVRGYIDIWLYWLGLSPLETVDDIQFGKESAICLDGLSGFSGTMQAEGFEGEYHYVEGDINTFIAFGFGAPADEEDSWQAVGVTNYDLVLSTIEFDPEWLK